MIDKEKLLRQRASLEEQRQRAFATMNQAAGAISLIDVILKEEGSGEASNDASRDLVVSSATAFGA